MRQFSNRRSRAAAGLLALALTAVACSSSKSSNASGGIAVLNPSTAVDTNAFAVTHATAAKYNLSTMSSLAKVASQLTLGGPAECQTNPFCIPGLQKTYGITFKSFKTLDADGPLTYQAVSGGQVDVGEVFSTDAQVIAHNLVVLTDDKHLQAADNITPVIASAKATSGVTKVVNKVSSALTTDILLSLNKSVGVDHQDPQAVADNWLKSKGLNATYSDASGQSISIAAFNFSESDLLAYIYGDALKAAGASVTVKPNLGSRQTLEPGLRSGQFDMLIEYAASALEFLDHGAGLASGNISNNVSHLKAIFAGKKA